MAAVKEPGKLTYDICSKYVDEIVTVNDDEICAAILRLLEREKLSSEGAGATSIAAVMFNKIPVKGKKTVCIVSGGNIDVTLLNRVINRGLLKSGRLCSIEIELEDEPGQLVEVSSCIARVGGNVTGVHYDRMSIMKKVSQCILKIDIETKNHEHIEQIKQELQKHGFTLYAQE